MEKKEQKPKKPLTTLDKYVIFCIIVMIIYTIADKITFVLTNGLESSTLTSAFFACFGGEVFLCAMIKRLKLKNEKPSKNNFDGEE